MRTVYEAAGRKLSGGIIQIAVPTPVELRGMDAKAQNGPLLQRVFLTHLVRAVQAPERVAAAAMAAVPKAMFVLVPVFAALLAFAYRSRRRHFPQHLAFALHMHAALFVTLTLMLAGRFVTMRLVNVAHQLSGQVGVSVYLLLATRTLYDGKTGDAIARLALAAALYFSAFIIAHAVILTLSVLAT